ncbi:MAG TPA: BON domain-containing protein [Ramlibacter sp.]|jgi:osmotically-inducible protein OsmY|uniref:BON domain-containing protein n=1 Tax=Ramlibacter sp. TaxID=1917967 RepID=UPI002D60ECBB|nr:BON domain-containing protein [Ramlibacter sp.]HZY17619.1 BON domain-containing protein [Ramlibacter sp.]
MQPANRHRVLGASTLLLALALGACGERSDGETVGQKLDGAVARTGEVARDAGQEAREATATARDTGRDKTAELGAAVREKTAELGSTTREATARAGDSARSATADVRTSVMGAAGTAGVKVDDAQITARVNASLMGDKDLKATRIDVDTRDGVVTLTGPVPSASAKARADEIAKNIRDVKSVNNQLTVSSS